MADLRVELYGQLVGHLVGTDWRTFDFRTARAAVERFSLGSTILSEAIPLELVPTRARARVGTSSSGIASERIVLPREKRSTAARAVRKSNVRQSVPTRCPTSWP